jgi:hypothetical protein
LNETDLPIAYNDVDFCLRLREAGYRTVWTPYAELYHHESASRGSDDTPAKQVRLAREAAYMKMHWGHILWTDPAYSPNLTFDREDFSLAWPPRIEPLEAFVEARPGARRSDACKSEPEEMAEPVSAKGGPRPWLPASGAVVPVQSPAVVGRAAAASQVVAAMRLPTR